MKRRHSRADSIALPRRARDLRPDIAFGADLIAGFPTESEDAFQRSLDLVEECGLAFLHIFPYSARRGTPAARMPHLPVALRRERAARLRAAGATARGRCLAAQVGRRARLLEEKLGASRFGQEVTPEEVRGALGQSIAALLEPVARPLVIDPALKPSVVLVVGVNGTGKTTTIGKLAQHFRAAGKTVTLVAGD